jgi:hypothetical protein
MGVQAMGIAGRDMPGIKGAMKEFVKNNRDNADQYLNLVDGFYNGVKGPDGVSALTENDPRPEYVHASFPKMLYHANPKPLMVGKKTINPVDGAIVVRAVEEMEAAIEAGWQLKPFPVVKVAVADPGIEKANLKRELAEKDGQITTLAQQMKDLEDKLNAVLAAKADEPEVKRGPGRPKKTEDQGA